MEAGKEIRTIIFDWGWTLHDPETDALFSGAAELIRNLSLRYTLALVSLAKRQTPEERRMVIEQSGIAHYFKYILIGAEDKDKLYGQLLDSLKEDPKTIMVVDDRTARGIRWGNHHGCTTVWIRKGKWMDELPTPETGEPTYTIGSIGELREIISQHNEKR